jgi:hypothetical protein
VAEPSLLLGGYTLKVWRYKNVGGIGVNIFKNGKRKFGVDFHKINYEGVPPILSCTIPPANP